MALQSAKRDLRKRMRQILGQIPATAIAQQSRVATQRFLSLAEYQNARSIAVYLSMPAGELSTTGIVHDALQRGKQVYIPYIYPVDSTSVMAMLSLASVAELEALQPDRWGIPSLLPAQVAGRPDCFATATGLDLIVMPGMAFDQGFRRLGHGKGYYDHFLTRYSQWNQKTSQTPQKMPFLVALSLQEQMMTANPIPVGEHDWLVDAIVVGDGRYLTRSG
ncbi:5-formyltetrahydrofolate cyclo-ligase [Penicillium lagena]|uniref:5-formyltetrahydrofolate cyclo-ligase n=1 Tax=Penicillium lagena TaxID=94218 RepID=UPI00253FA0B2|nr:5-formyltetrahydrofolate cyclo-ligase [Penicillium lagena]KAJ5610003.1 5-formyltetrahydrofolate cyclo-ligase [Penicillium lagena]